MERRNQAIQYLAIQLLEHGGDDRHTAAMVFEHDARDAQDALMVLPGHDSPHVIELYQELERVACLARRVVEWHEQIAMMPQEFCSPEPDLFCLTGLEPQRPGRLPWFIFPNRLLGQRLARTLSAEDELGRVYLAITVFKPAVGRLASVADSLAWPVLAHLSRELGAVLDNLDFVVLQPGDIWNGRLDGDKEEATVMFRGTDLLSGVLDKASFGAETAGITHMCFELLGGHLASLWLSGIARLFTLLLQMRGFTCAYEDLVLRPEIDEIRTGLVKQARVAAIEVAQTWIHKHDPTTQLPAKPTLQDLSQASKSLFQQKETVEHLEGLVIGKMKEFWSGMINKCIPIGQRLPVPRNCFASMVQTGAKGSKVNQSQVSCCLGQQELEGRLPPLMATSRSLPCFAVNDLSNRTRGYIADRFLTGIRPQELRGMFFFHCMAGREGLVDTAVKTSRSGYLQRCLVKHMESLKAGKTN
eukprot:s919_g19.t1